jgi:hypothetical protein
MWLASLAFFGRKVSEREMLTGHLDLATIESSQVARILIAFNAGNTLCALILNRGHVPKDACKGTGYNLDGSLRSSFTSHIRFGTETKKRQTEGSLRLACWTRGN